MHTWYDSGEDVESFVIPLLLYANPTCASGCEVLRKSVLERDALFMGWIGLEAFPCFLIRRASVDGRWRRNSFEAGDSVADEMRIFILRLVG